MRLLEIVACFDKVVALEVQFGVLDLRVLFSDDTPDPESVSVLIANVVSVGIRPVISFLIA